ncbi:MAG: hypothetical protein M1828_004981 [Chrysothrix sp. TS-e1954]|nr:MAG: hypothetical protein M1828_004981 [Chrysothrix sp. TS-e1954]
MGSIAHRTTPKGEYEDAEGFPGHSQSSLDSEDHPQDEAPPAVPKRKGGRKPIYATAEERKQRNRQAQAAFRERRTEYIKQLEVNIRDNETKIEEMQQSHKTVAEECQSLRHRNLLLEKLLIDRGVDPHAEMRNRGVPRSNGSGSSNGSQNNARMMQQATMNRHNQVRRAPASLAPKLETHSSIDSPLNSPHTGTASDSPTHAVSPESPVIISPAVHQPGSFPTSAYAPQQQMSPHVSPYTDGHAQFQGFHEQQFNRPPFGYNQIGFGQHHSTASTPDTTSPAIGQNGAPFGYPQQLRHDRNLHSGKLSPFFTPNHPVELCSS